MTLKALQRQWDAWGREDPLWAAVTRTDKLGGRWDVEEFMRGGRDEVDLVLGHLRDLGVTVDLRRALDFGCGVGRYTQALADRFERTDGVDIAPSMLRQARELNRHGDRCRYHHNTREDLSLFTDGSFTFVYSMLVLQHMRPRYAARYLEELLRVLAPGGAAVIQVPAAAPASGAGEEGRIPAVPLPDDAFRARIEAGVTRLSLQAGALFVVEARVSNLSSHSWPAAPSRSGLFHVQLANRWLHPNGEIHARDDVRVALPCDPSPGQQLDMNLHFIAPATGGEYVLELDLVQEGVAWFQERGSPTVRIPCTVHGGAESPPGARIAAERRTLFAGFRERRPRLHAALRRLGIVPLYRASMARIRRLRAWWRRWRHPRPVMEMHAVPSREVERIIAAGGGRLLETDTERWPDGILSARYWVVKGLSGRPGSAA
jgi:SAM-dependent methyltransferase